jgi:hypothetical protein
MLPLTAKFRTCGNVPSLVGVVVLANSVVEEASVGMVLLGRGLQALPAAKSAVLERAKAANARTERIVKECNDGVQTQTPITT